MLNLFVTTIHSPPHAIMAQYLMNQMRRQPITFNYLISVIHIPLFYSQTFISPPLRKYTDSYCNLSEKLNKTHIC